ncbi:MAG: MGMT family protein [Planctomycetes bacterium]|nr:MGMT family protein [Planctomycetota bacterium]
MKKKFGIPSRSADPYKQIYAVVHCIPKGRVATYGQIAALLGRERHARQVGHAMSALPAGSTVPWHRVINAKGELSLRDPYHESLQQKLLEAEGVVFDKNGRISLHKFRWEPS